MSNPAYRRIGKEISKLALKTLEGDRVQLMSGDNLQELIIKFKMSADKDSYLQNSTFILDVHIPTEYPFAAPKVKFSGHPPLHPNVSSQTGAICLNILKSDEWSAALRVESIIPALEYLLMNPNTADPLDSVVASMWDGGPDGMKGMQVATVWSSMLHGCTQKADPIMLKMVDDVVATGISARAALYGCMMTDFFSVDLAVYHNKQEELDRQRERTMRDRIGLEGAVGWGEGPWSGGAPGSS